MLLSSGLDVLKAIKLIAATSFYDKVWNVIGKKHFNSLNAPSVAKPTAIKHLFKKLAAQ